MSERRENQLSFPKRLSNYRINIFICHKAKNRLELNIILALMNTEKLEQLKQKILQTTKLLKINELQQHAQKLSLQMNEPKFWDDQEKAQTISQDYQDITKEVEKWDQLEKRVDDLLELGKSKDKSLEKEIEEQTGKLEKEYEDYEFYLLLDGPHDKNNAVIAIHAGSGGTEAQDWAEMLLRMLMRFCEKQNWKVTILDESRGSEAGYKSIMLAVKGRYAYGYLKSEHGVHRLVRISPFDAEKMRHTSFASIEVLPELDEKIEIKIKGELDKK